ncbi:MAG: hypothetical protein JWO67_2976, partial [Streptosporangiaceae bacterium]|nr:hypothetical protein [Streptosporangiaceae bacterium]
SGACSPPRCLLSFVPIAVEEATSDTKVMLSLFHLAVAAALFPMLRGPRSPGATSPDRRVDNAA